MGFHPQASCVQKVLCIFWEPANDIRHPHEKIGVGKHHGYDRFLF